MANTKSDYATFKRNLPQPNDAFVSIIPVLLILGAAAPVLNDTIELLTLPAGVELVDWDITAPQLDSNGAPVLAANLGALNAGKTDLGAIYGGGALGNAANGNVVRNADARCLIADGTVERVLALKWTVIAATWAGAGKRLLVNLHLRG